MRYASIHANCAYRINAYYANHLHTCTNRYVCCSAQLICRTSSQDIVHNVLGLGSVPGVDHRRLLVHRYVVNVYIPMCYFKTLAWIHVQSTILLSCSMAYEDANKHHNLCNIWLPNFNTINLYFHRSSSWVCIWLSWPYLCHLAIKYTDSHIMLDTWLAYSPLLMPCSYSTLYSISQPGMKDSLYPRHPFYLSYYSSLHYLLIL